MSRRCKLLHLHLLLVLLVLLHHVHARPTLRRAAAKAKTKISHSHGRARGVLCAALASRPAGSVDAQALLQETVRLFNANDLDAALVCAQDATRLYPNNPNGHFHLASVYERQRKHAEQEAALQEVRRLAPSFSPGLAKLATAQRILGRYAAAVDSYTALVALHRRELDLSSDQGKHSLSLDYFMRGTILHMLNQLPRAVADYDQALALRPTFADAHANRGAALKNLGRIQEASDAYKRALDLDSANGRTWYNYGNLLAQLGQHSDAVRVFRKSIELDPQQANTHNNLGNAYRALGDYKAAVACFERAVQVSPDPTYRYQLAGALQEAGNLERSLDELRQVVALDPNNGEAYTNIGNVLMQLGHLQQAFDEGFQRAIDVNPDDPHYWMNAGALRFAQYKLHEAAAMYERALQIDSTYADAYSNLGNAYIRMGKLNEAVKAHKHAAQLQPDSAAFWSNLGSAHYELGHLQDSVDAYKRAHALDPTHQALGSLVHTLTRMCDWEQRDAYMPAMLTLLARDLALLDGPDHKLNASDDSSVLPFAALLYPQIDEATLLRIAQLQARKLAVRSGAVSLAQPLLTADAKGQRVANDDPRLRIGLLSSDLRNHAVGRQLEPMLALLDRQRLETTAYSLASSDESRVRKALEQNVDHFKFVGAMGSVELAKQIVADGMHIAVDLNGHTSNGRMEVMALHPAPVVVNFLGFPSTSGSTFHHYIVTDSKSSDPTHQHFYSEKLALMPNTYQLAEHAHVYPWTQLLNISREQETQLGDELEPSLLVQHRRAMRAKYGIPDNAIVYSSFNQLYKLDKDTFALWMNILKQVDGSVLWLLSNVPEASPILKRAAQRHGINPDRLIMADLVAKEDHLRRAMAADVHLDSPHYNAHTVATDVLWAGVPMVTMPLVKMPSRVAMSLSYAIGVPDMVVQSPEAYVRLAVDLGQSSSRRLAMAQTLRRNRLSMPLFDNARWAGHFASLTTLMWEVNASRGAGSMHVLVAREQRQE